MGPRSFQPSYLKSVTLRLKISDDHRRAIIDIVGRRPPPFPCCRQRSNGEPTRSKVVRRPEREPQPSARRSIATPPPGSPREGAFPRPRGLRLRGEVPQICRRTCRQRADYEPRQQQLAHRAPRRSRADTTTARYPPPVAPRGAVEGDRQVLTGCALRPDEDVAKRGARGRCNEQAGDRVTARSFVGLDAPQADQNQPVRDLARCVADQKLRLRTDGPAALERTRSAAQAMAASACASAAALWAQRSASNHSIPASARRRRARSKRGSALVGSSTGATPVGATTAASSARLHPRSGRTTRPARARTPESTQARFPIQAHDHRLELVVGVVGRGDQIAPCRPGMSREQRVAQLAGARGQVRGAFSALGK